MQIPFAIYYQFQSQAMFNNFIKQNKEIKRPTTEQETSKQKKKKKLSPQIFNQRVPIQKLINFEQKKYPFPNQPLQHSYIYKTSLNINQIQGQAIKLLASITHPHIIGLKKILRSSVKSLNHKNGPCLFSLIYQVVPYQLKYIGCGDLTLHKLFKLVAKLNFKDTLNSVSMFLFSQGIYHPIKLTDIGVTEEGSLKIYIPPQPIIKSSELTKDRNLIDKNNQKLINWWETTFHSTEMSQEASDQKSKANTNLFKQWETQSNESIIINQHQQKAAAKPKESPKNIYSLSHSKDIAKHNILSNALKSSCKSFTTELSKITLLQRQKMKKIDNQIKMIKERIHKKPQKEKRKDSDNALLQRHLPPNTHKNNNIFESERFEKRIDQNKFGTDHLGFRDSIQQNINCINIYNHSHNNLEKKVIKESKNFSKCPVLSFMIKPPEPAQSKPNYVLQQFGEYFDNPFQDIDNEQSLDTYEIQQNEKDEELQPILQQPKYRQTVDNLTRQTAERNKKMLQYDFTPEKNKPSPHNIVENRHFTTQSAGPIQFKNYVNKYIKPQFLSKKSNIYQDPLEEDSQPSTHRHKKLQQLTKIQQLVNAGRNVFSDNEQSSPAKESCISKQQNRPKISQEFIPRTSSDHQLIHLNFFNKTKDSGLKTEPFFKQTQEPLIIARVQQIVKKTKNAINILNKAKRTVSPINKNRISKSP